MTNVLLWSGCRRISNRLGEILARYAHRTSFSAIAEITNHDRSPSLERAQERCLSPTTTLTTIFPLLPGLLYAFFSSTSTKVPALIITHLPDLRIRTRIPSSHLHCQP